MADHPRHAAPSAPKGESGLATQARRVVDPLRRFPDPAQSADPRQRHVVSALGRLGSPALDDGYRRELRAQLVAVAPRLVAEGAAETATRAAGTTSTASTTVAKHAPQRRPLGRIWGVAGALVLVCLLVLGGLSFASRSALPGDSLYGLKLASEDAQLHFAPSTHARAYDYLHFSELRVRESQQLLAARDSALGGGTQAAGGAPAASTLQLIATALRAANSDLRRGTTLLGQQAFSRGQGKPLTLMASWAPYQIKRLSSLVDATPAGAVREQARAARTLVVQAQRRDVDLQRLGATDCPSPTRDQFGPMPCGSGASAIPGTSHSSTPSSPRKTLGSSTPSRHSGRSGSGSARPGTGTSSGSGAPDGSSPPTGSGTGSGSDTGSGSGSVGSGDQSDRTTHRRHHLPVSVNSCGASVSLPGLSGTVGVCPPSGN